MDIEHLRALCLALPYVTEDIKWEKDLCFCIGEKMFCVTGLESTSFGVSIKVPAEQFNELVERDGIIPAPYLARYNWVAITQADGLKPEEWEIFIKKSYELVKAKLPKKLLKSLEG